MSGTSCGFMRDLASLRLQRRYVSVRLAKEMVARVQAQSGRKLCGACISETRLTGSACCPRRAAGPPTSRRRAPQASTRACSGHTRGGRRECTLCGWREETVSRSPGRRYKVKRTLCQLQAQHLHSRSLPAFPVLSAPRRPLASPEGSRFVGARGRRCGARRRTR